MWQFGRGGGFGVSDVALMHIMLAGPAISALAGCGPVWSEVACSEVTFPLGARCAFPEAVTARIAAASKKSTGNVSRVFIARLQTFVDSILVGTALQHIRRQRTERLSRCARRNILIQAKEICGIVLRLDPYQPLPPFLICFRHTLLFITAHEIHIHAGLHTGPENVENTPDP